MRAARTDKGVSAVGQVVSLKAVLEPPGLVDRINAALPEQVRACLPGAGWCCACSALCRLVAGSWWRAGGCQQPGALCCCEARQHSKRPPSSRFAGTHSCTHCRSACLATGGPQTASTRASTATGGGAWGMAAGPAWGGPSFRPAGSRCSLAARVWHMHRVLLAIVSLSDRLLFVFHLPTHPRSYEYILPEWAFDPRRGLGRAAQAAAAAAAADVAAAAEENAALAAAAGEEAQQQQQSEEQQQDPQQSEEQQQAANGSGEPMAVDGAAAAGEAPAAPAAEAAAPAAEAAEPAEAAAEPAAAAAADAGKPFVFDDACVARMNAILRNVRLGGGSSMGRRAAPAAACLLRGRQRRRPHPLPVPSTTPRPSIVSSMAVRRHPQPPCLHAFPSAARPVQHTRLPLPPLPQLQYEGTHNFHNYTVRKPATAPDAKRYILSFRRVWWRVLGGGVADH